MLLAPDGLDERELLRVVDEQYGVRAAALEFSPLGEDSWSYRLGDLWVSVRRDLRGHLPAAYEGAGLLREIGLDFVLAPIAGADGRVSRVVSGFPLVVFPFVAAVALDGAGASRHERRDVVGMLSRVHAASIAGDLPRESYELSFDDDLDLVVELATRDPDTGPYSRPLHELLAVHLQTIVALRREFAALAVACASSRGAFVVTHGEPIPSNVLRHRDGLLLADWGEAMWAPPERDWAHVIRTLDVQVPCRPQFKRLYDIRWILSEIAEYTTVFARAHTGDDDDVAMWSRLQRYLPGDERPEPAPMRRGRR
jgi:spectinomycin phosphotransferase